MTSFSWPVKPTGRNSFLVQVVELKRAREETSIEVLVSPGPHMI